MCSVIDGNLKLKNTFTVLLGEEVSDYRDKFVIRNWTEIFPDVDILLIDKRVESVAAIFSCKTSLRERLTETAFWKRELERQEATRNIKLVFVTSNKDRELELDTNRYILLHVIDYTFVTDPERYDELIETYRRRYGDREDFDVLLSKVRPVREVESFLLNLIE